MMRRWILLLSLAAAAAGLGFAGRGVAVADTPGLPAAMKDLRDYRGKGTIQVTIPEMSMLLRFEQAYVAPDAILFGFDMDLLRQWSLFKDDTERTYNPSTGFLVERRYRNLHRLPVNPTTSVQMSMAHWGRIIHDLKNMQSLGTESVLGHECRLLRFSNKELTDNLLARGVVGNLTRKFLGKGMSQAWVTEAQGLPVRIEIHDNDGTTAVLLAFSELKINGGVRRTDLRIPAPPQALVASVNVDVSLPNWEETAEAEAEKQIEALRAAQNAAAGRPTAVRPGQPIPGAAPTLPGQPVPGAVGPRSNPRAARGAAEEAGQAGSAEVGVSHGLKGV
jgi:hypothetical protein